MQGACSLGWWSTARPASPHSKYIYPTFSKWCRTHHHPLYTAPMVSTCSEFPYLQFLEPRNALESTTFCSTLICSTEKLLLSLKQEHCRLCSSLSLIFSLSHCQKRCSSWTVQRYDASNLLCFLFLLSEYPPPLNLKSNGCNFPVLFPVGIPHLPTASQHPRKLLTGCKPPKFSFY